MTKLAYLECPTGLAGDMCLGALVDSGVPLEYLVEKLSLLGISQEYNVWAERVHRNGLQATKVHVDLAPSPHSHPTPHDHPHPTSIGSPLPESADSIPTHTHEHRHDHGHDPTYEHRHDHAHSHSTSRHLLDIEALIQAADLPDRVKNWSLHIFQQLAAAEAAVHGIPPEQVHFHEVGATDAIVDIVGSCIGFDWLGIEQFYCSALPVGGGTVRAAHGLLPVPAPAVLKLLEMRHVPIYSNGIDRELVTPTGAAIVTALATSFGRPPAMQLQRVGLGAGSRNLPIPNMLRLWIGTLESVAEIKSLPSKQASTTSAIDPHFSEFHSSQSLSSSVETITLLETQIDDLNPQAIGYVFEALFAAGALDVFTQAIGMKKSRLGVLLTVVCHPQQTDACETVLFRETSTLGIRRSQQQRAILPRQFETVETPYGKVRIKITQRGANPIINGQPEYEDCATLARECRVPWQEVYRLALCQWYHCQTHQIPKNL
ncbi:nickel pincer cofactor biosynthesis protein LarC [Thermocoleostomius sinensis]|uniref:Putative nickel insertion protein n=1 Tax=Thermocoleostomius sinensis A174 TaxID=2016057 RepID=A0A9E8ZH25_9CYAN|nr:nickel pincer cofactor biosynthesis protein LarC [Thermocoleostomius sinensis]WAL61694.1 nickel pincer cofactor biosynthesis protein LarC [Thermocoleostomius sinensis A174]